MAGGELGGAVSGRREKEGWRPTWRVDNQPFAFISGLTTARSGGKQQSKESHLPLREEAPLQTVGAERCVKAPNKVVSATPRRYQGVEGRANEGKMEGNGDEPSTVVRPCAGYARVEHCCLIVRLVGEGSAFEGAGGEAAGGWRGGGQMRRGYVVVAGGGRDHVQGSRRVSTVNLVKAPSDSVIAE